jgi:hypothetical protein
MILAAGIYPNLPSADYHADPAPDPSLSSSIARTLLTRSPVHALVQHARLAKRQIAENKIEFDLGNAAHAMLLHDDRTFAICGEDNWRTKAARELREAAYAAGHIPILARQLEATREMVDCCRAQLAEHECGTAFSPDHGDSEVTLIWREPCGVWARARLDWLPREREREIIIYDYKSTATPAHPDIYQRTAFNMGLHVQAAWYIRGLEQLLGVTARCRFVVQENEPPYAISVLEMTPAAMALADAQVERAIEIWRQCLDTGIWPGYPARVCYLDAPGWYQARFDEREEREPMSDNMVERWIDAQRPREEL